MEEEYKPVCLFILKLPLVVLQVTYVHDIVSLGRWCLSLCLVLYFIFYSLLCSVINNNRIIVHILLPAAAKTQYPPKYHESNPIYYSRFLSTSSLLLA